MLTVILAGTAILAAAWLLSKLFPKKRGDGGDKAPTPSLTQTGDPLPVQRVDPGPSVQGSRDPAITAIANKITFSSRPVAMEEVVAGTRLAPSPVPTPIISVRGIRSLSEIPQALPQVNAYDDDIFFAKLATHQLPVIEYQRREDIVATRYGVPRNQLVFIQDVSGSMKEFGRMRWARRFCEEVLSRAEAAHAETTIIPFSDTALPPHTAFGPDGYKRLRSELDSIFSPIQGTNIPDALQAGFAILEDGAFTVRKMVFVTDGTQDFNHLWAASKLKELKIQLHVVCIGVDNDKLRAIAHSYDLFRAGTALAA